KFMPRFDDSYTVTCAFPECSVYTLDLPDSSGVFPTFHSSLIHPFVPNNDTLSPSCALNRLGPVVTVNGEQEWEVEEIID
ncbi:hypothetical protein FA95DRAFT_1457435, partial [Auriscalpium vulgare]